MEQNEALHKAKELLTTKPLSFWVNESWIVLSENWELNVWQDELTGEYKASVFPIDACGDIAGKGIPVYVAEMIRYDRRSALLGDSCRKWRTSP